MSGVVAAEQNKCRRGLGDIGMVRRASRWLTAWYNMVYGMAYSNVYTVAWWIPAQVVAGI